MLNTETASFSTIRFFRYFEDELKKIDTYPLTIKNLTIQQDEYKRLAADGDDVRPLQEAPFAHIGFFKKEKDSAMRFDVVFYRDYITVDIEPYQTVYFALHSLGSEQEAAHQLVLLLQMLANGQIATIVTARNEITCAVELVLYPGADKLPIVLSMQTKYAWWWKMDEPEDAYDVLVLKNDFGGSVLDVPKNFFLRDMSDDEFLFMGGRTFHSNHITPLTKQKYSAVAQKVTKANIKNNASLHQWFFLHYQWEFWALSLLFGLGDLILASYHQLPPYVAAHPYSHLLIVPTIILLLRAVFHKKQDLAAHHPDHPYIVFDKFVKRLEGIKRYILFDFILLSTIFFPVYVTKSSHQTINLLQLTQDHPLVYTVPIVYILSLILLAAKNKYTRVFGVFLGTLATLIMLYANNNYTDTAASTPEPFTSIVITAIFIQLCMIGYVVIRLGVGMLLRGRNTNPDQSVRKLERIYKFVAKVEPVCIVACGFTLMIAAYFMRIDIPADSITIKPAIILPLFVFLLGLAAITLGYTIVKKITTGSTITWFVLGLFFGGLLLPSLLLKDGSPEGAATGYVLWIVSLLTLCSITAIREVCYAQFKDKEIKNNI